MTKRTRPSGKFLDAIHRLAAAYRVELDTDQIAAYWAGLDDLTPVRLETAVDAAIRTNQWLPKVAELRRLANDVAEPKRQQYINGEPVFDCHVCEDSGTLLVWDHHTVMEVRDVGEPKSWRTYVVSCTCSSGDRWRRRNLRMFDERRMRRPQHAARCRETGEMLKCYPGLPSDADKEDLREWIESKRGITSHRNYTDFGDYAADRQGAF